MEKNNQKHLSEFFVLSDLGNDTFESNKSTHLMGFSGIMFGGHTFSLAVKAALLTLSPSSTNKLINSVHASFIRPAKSDISITYKIYDKKDGALFSRRSVSATQKGKLVLTCFVSFKATTGDNEAGKLIYNNQEKPSVPGPNHPECVPDEQYQHLLPWNSQGLPFQTRFIPATEWHRKGWDPMATLAMPTRARTAIWLKPKQPMMRSRESSHAVQNDSRVAVLMASDHEIGATIFISYPDFGHSKFATLDLCVWFEDSQIDIDQWHLYDMQSLSASQCGSDGLTLTMSRVFQEDGTLVATVVQQAYIIGPKL